MYPLASSFEQYAIYGTIALSNYLIITPKVGNDMSFPILHRGDKVALVCTGSSIKSRTDGELTKNYYLQNHGLDVIYGVDLLQGTSPLHRAEILMEYLLDDDVRLIHAMRGGEGSADLLPFIHQHHDKLASLAPKFLLGFSDVTPLLNYFSHYYQWPCIHGMGALQMLQQTIDESSIHNTLALLLGQQSQHRITNLQPLNDVAKAGVNCTATLCGGNLSLATISVQDIWDIQTENRILFLEDIGEPGYKTGRSLKYLQRIGKLDGVKAVILGDFAHNELTDTEKKQAYEAHLDKTLQRFADSCDRPVFKSNQFGHGHHNQPLFLSLPARLQDNCLTFNVTK